MRAPLAAPRASMPHAAVILSAAAPATDALRSLVVSVVVSLLALISLRSPAARLASGAAGQ